MARFAAKLLYKPAGDFCVSKQHLPAQSKPEALRRKGEEDDRRGREERGHVEKGSRKKGERRGWEVLSRLILGWKELTSKKVQQPETNQKVMTVLTR